MSSQAGTRFIIIRPDRFCLCLNLRRPVSPFHEDRRMSKELLKAVPFVVGLSLIAFVAGLPSGCSDEIKTDAPPHAGNSVSPVVSETQAAKTETPPAAKHVRSAAVSDVKPLLKGWAKPAVALVFSGEQHGYMEPCG